MGTFRPRTLAEALRRIDDRRLARLLVLRADLVHPAPGDLGQLASRATSSASVARAVNRLDAFAVELLEALISLPEPVGLPELADALGQPEQLVAERLIGLRDLALAWGDDDDLRTVRAVHELLGPTPAGLGPATTRHYGDLDTLIEAAGEEARGVLDALTWGPPTGAVERADHDVTIRTARGGVDQLLARGLVVARDPTTVVLPRQIGLHLRGGRVHRETHPEPPPLQPVAVNPRIAEVAAAGAALAAVNDVERALDAITAQPPGVLRSGGLGMRDLRALGSRLQLDQTRLGTLLEVAWGAGLLAEYELGRHDVFVTTTGYDGWLELEPAERWAQLATCWRDGLRVAGLAGTSDERGRTYAVLEPDLDRLLAPEIRGLVLRGLAAADGAVPPDHLRDWVGWHRPRRGGRLRDDLVGWTLAEAAVLGVSGLGALSEHGAALAAGADATVVAAALASRVPAPVEHVVLQADLTAVAPGPLRREVADELGLLAVAESHGVAQVYRFSDDSVRRALDHGRSAEDITEWLTAHSTTPLPQPLAYLIGDVARRHGVLRLGVASTYLRCDDTALLGRLLGAGAVPGVAFRRIADTVLVSSSAPDVVLQRLRDTGLSPVPEGDDRVLQLAAAAPRRVDPPRSAVAGRPAQDPDTVAGLVAALRARDGGFAVHRRCADNVFEEPES